MFLCRVTTQWYKSFEGGGTADSMWEQWFIYYAYSQKLFTIYNNLKVYNSDASSCLCINRREVGLHVGSKGSEDYCKLLDKWNDNYVTLSQNITKLDWNGKYGISSNKSLPWSVKFAHKFAEKFNSSEMIWKTLKPFIDDELIDEVFKRIDK